jgi:hypothetical protein
LRRGRCEKIQQYLLSLEGRGEGEGEELKNFFKLFIPLPPGSCEKIGARGKERLHSCPGARKIRLPK